MREALKIIQMKQIKSKQFYLYNDQLMQMIYYYFGKEMKKKQNNIKEREKK